MKLINEALLETVFLFIFIGAMLWVGLGDVWGHRIEHPFPFTYFASDAFQHQTRAQWIKENDNYLTEGPHYSAGFTDVVGFYPPILHHVSVLFSHLSGVEVYDAILFLTVSFAIIGGLIFYAIIRRCNKKIAVLSLPVMINLFTIQEARNAFFWGNWPALFGDFFLVAVFWALMSIHEQNKKTGLLLGVFLAGTILGHTSATVFSLVFIILFMGVSIFFKRFDRRQFSAILLGFGIAVVIGFHFFQIFRQIWMVHFPFNFSVMTDWGGGGGIVGIESFGYPILVVLGAGGIILLFSKHQNLFFHKIIAVFSVVAGFTNYVGFSMRAFNFRFYWPILFSIFFGTAVYAVIRKIKRNTSQTAVVLISVFILAGVIRLNFTSTGPIGEMMNEYTWETMNWLKENTPSEAKIFFFYGDVYDQDGSLGNTNRISTRVEITDLINTVQGKFIERMYPTKQLIEMGGLLSYKKGFLSYQTRVEDDFPSRKVRDLCGFDYYVFDKAGRFPVFVGLNVIIANTFLKENLTIVFQNRLNVVMKNQKPGGNCFGKDNIIRL